MYQKCPNCKGTGLEVSYLSIGKFPVNIPKNTCQVCFGKKIINTKTGKPPRNS